MQVLFQNLIVTAGHPGFGMALAVSAGMANVLLDYVFMVPLQMGIRGSALGTGIGYLIPTVAGICFFAGTRGHLKFAKPKVDFALLAESCANGFSEMVSQMASAVTTFFFNMVMLRLLGENGVAAITIMIYTQFMLSALYIGFSMGVAPVISYRYGLGDAHCLRKIFRICLFFMITVSVVVFVLSMVLGGPLTGVFARKGTPVYDIVREGFRIFQSAFSFAASIFFLTRFLRHYQTGVYRRLFPLCGRLCFPYCSCSRCRCFFGKTGYGLRFPYRSCQPCLSRLGFLVRCVRCIGESGIEASYFL